jgi:LicD family protein
LMIIARICRKHQITYMISYGTLLGSLRHHDIIPWDDDIDVMIPYEERLRFLDLIQKMNTTSVQTNLFGNQKKPRYYKISFKNTLPAGDEPWNFPFVDVFFYVKNETYLWETDGPNVIVKTKYVFPLVMRPLGELWLPAPRKPRRMFKFDPFDECKGHWWDHRKEGSAKETSIKCDELRHIYPFAERHNQSDSIEILKINDTIIHIISYTDKNSFLFD